MKKKTISKEIFFEGIGLHTGEEAKLRIVPSEKGQIVFIKDHKEVLGHYKNVKDTMRGVVLEDKGLSIYTVEHLVSALWGMEIDSAEIVLEKGYEVPALDGSALFFAEAIYNAGYVNIDKEIEYVECDNITLKMGDKEVSCTPSETSQITYFIDFPKPIGTQVLLAPLNNASFYLENIAPARTFIFDFEVEEVKEMGIAKGGSLENTVVFKKDGIYNENLRFKDEPVRHKILDFIGDTALLGKRIKGSVLVKKAGHREHIAFLKKMEECHGV